MSAPTGDICPVVPEACLPGVLGRSRKRLHTLSIVLNALVNVFILLTFLTVFYMTYAAKLERSVLNEELKRTIGKEMPAALRKADRGKGDIRTTIRASRPELMRLARAYAGDDKATTTYNRMLFGMSAGTCAALLVVIIAVVVVLYRSCLISNRNLHFWDIVRENAWIFLCVGAVEFLFFTHVATKWVPTAPSTMVRALLGTVRRKFSPGSRDDHLEFHHVKMCPPTCPDVWPCISDKSMRTWGIVVGLLVILATTGVIVYGALRGKVVVLE